MLLLTALGQLGLGAIVFVLRPHTKLSWVFLGFCLSWFGLFVTLYDFASTYVFSHFLLLCWYMTSAFLLHLAFLFPEERSSLRSYPWIQYLVYVPSLVLWGYDLLSPLVLPVNRPHVALLLTQIYTVYWAATLLFLLGSLTYTVWRATSPVARSRAVTVFFGFAAGFIIPVCAESAALLFQVNLPLEGIWLLTLFLPLSITYAMLRYNLFNVSALLRRTLTYSVLTGTVIVIYLLLIKISDKLLHDLPLSQSRGFSVLFGLAVLFGLNPLRERIQSFLDRVFFHSRYDFRQTIEELSQDLTTLLDLDEIARRIVHTVMRALNVTSVALYLDNGQGTYTALEVAGETALRLARVQPTRDDPVVALVARRRGLSRYDMEADPALLQRAPTAPEVFECLGISLALPLLFKGELIGLLALGDKKSGAVFIEEDLELLRTLANQSAIALANAHAYRSLEETNAALRAALRKVELLEHVKTHLGKFVPAAVRQIIERDPTAPALDKHEQDVTVLFLDIAGYTSISEALDQEQVNYLIERYFSSFLDDIYAHQGDINETAGDGLMIIFQHDDPRAHASAAVRTALAIRDKTRHINAELAETYTPIAVNMGINSGVAAVGSTKFESAIGTRWTFTASGPVTNLAARIGAHASDGGIYIGAETARRLAEAFVLCDLGPQTFKNMREPVEVYEVLEKQKAAEPVHV
jgi:class 3 adenylate cyclase